MLPIAGAICLAVSQPSAPDAGEPPGLRAPAAVLPTSAVSVAGFAPRGWGVELARKGDLNGDGWPDLVAILKGRDPNCIVTNAGVPNAIDTNPRQLLVAFGSKSGFVLRAISATIIPRIDDPYMDDPFDPDALTIRRGVLSLGLNYWRSMGGWRSYSTKLSFRWDGKQMRLIGYDRDALQRNSGETEVVSINFVTGRASIIKGSLEDDIEDNRQWQRIPAQKIETLETIADGLAFQPKLRAYH